MSVRDVLLIGAVAMVAACRTEPPDRWTVKFTHVYSANTDYQRMAEHFRALMLDRTGGRFRVVIYPSGQLGDERVAFEQLQFGAQQMAISGTPVLSGWVPEGQVFDLPYLFQTAEQGDRALNGTLGRWWRDLFLEKTGVRVLGFLEYGFRHVYNRRRPIREPKDLAGLKLRVLQNSTYLRTYDALGVQATPMAYGEVYSALQQGVIDGGEANVIGYMTDRFYEVAPYFSFTTVTYNPIALLVGDRFYRSLPPDIREALDRSAADALAFQHRIARDMQDEAIRQMAAAGITVTRPDLDPFVAAVRPGVWDDLGRRLHDGPRLLEWVHRETRWLGEGDSARPGDGPW